MKLEGKRIAILVATGYHEHELLFPYYRFKEAGASVTVAGPEAGATVYGEGRHGMDGLPFAADAAIGDLKADDFDAIHIPGGIYGPLALRDREDVCQLAEIVTLPAMPSEPGEGFKRACDKTVHIFEHMFNFMNDSI